MRKVVADLRLDVGRDVALSGLLSLRASPIVENSTGVGLNRVVGFDVGAAVLLRDAPVAVRV